MNKFFHLAVRVVISGLFFYSGWIKLQDLQGFALAIHGYQLLPDCLILLSAYTLPWLEIWCAVALWITPPFRRSAWIWITLLLLVFTAAKISVLQRGIETTCGCSGTGELMTWKDVWSNLVWLALSLTGWSFDARVAAEPRHGCFATVIRHLSLGKGQVADQ